jgi:hypothetical protein
LLNSTHARTSKSSMPHSRVNSVVSIASALFPLK